MAAHDWDLVKGAYKQYVRLLQNSEDYPVLLPDLRESLAERLKVLAALYPDREDELVFDYLETVDLIDPSLSHISSLVDRRRALIYRDEPIYTTEVRPIPSVATSVIQTCKRLADLRLLTSQLRDYCLAIVLGGSLSYGKFYNVDVGSDVDLLIVVESWRHTHKFAQAAADSGLAQKKSAEALRARSKIFSECVGEPFDRERHKSWIFSHKLNTRNGYGFSLHIVDMDCFRLLTLQDMDLPIHHPNFKPLLLDHRDKRPHKKRQYEQRAFDGSIRLHEPSIRKDNLTSGYTCEMLAFEVYDGQFFTGLQQNLLLPQLEVRHDQSWDSVRLQLIGFKAKIWKRLLDEQTKRPYEILRLSNCHTRYYYMSSYVRQEMDSSMT